ncbi:Uncharacterised protein [Pannonibacter phragmitetus]|uniref:Uncharacterized protein n=1 Tax=Pannonibacter phragmitetus TaxID=121719 RepID=A0A378ZV93_9HYPH|nr:hypothetical protein [Pannonibacter phragmitetus]SUB01008.1 Uncharacterised protein [Pannonibacter phragmitetus]
MVRTLLRQDQSFGGQQKMYLGEDDVMDLNKFRIADAQRKTVKAAWDLPLSDAAAKPAAGGGSQVAEKSKSTRNRTRTLNAHNAACRALT